MNVPENNIDVVYNSGKPVNIEENTYKECIVLTIGHVVDYKNPETWFKVAKKVVSYNKVVKFIWLGNGKLLEKMRAAVYANVDEFGLLQNASKAPRFNSPGTSTEGQAFFLMMEGAFRKLSQQKK